MNKKLALQLWDTSGRTHTVAETYFNFAQGFILMYDVTDRRSFESLDQWLRLIMGVRGSNLRQRVIIVGTKADLPRRSALRLLCLIVLLWLLFTADHVSVTQRGFI
jgi:GTPase SAR1 family protein